MMSAANWESRLPVGSSASSSGGVIDDGAGYTHPLLFATGEHHGQITGFIVQKPTLSNAAETRLCASAGVKPSMISGKATLSKTERSSSRQ